VALARSSSESIFSVMKTSRRKGKEPRQTAGLYKFDAWYPADAVERK
jgi:hypothetical protein